MYDAAVFGAFHLDVARSIIPVDEHGNEAADRHAAQCARLARSRSSRPWRSNTELIGVMMAEASAYFCVQMARRSRSQPIDPSSRLT